jgi:hypothetical protein
VHNEDKQIRAGQTSTQETSSLSMRDLSSATWSANQRLNTRGQNLAVEQITDERESGQRRRKTSELLAGSNTENGNRQKALPWCLRGPRSWYGKTNPRAKTFSSAKTKTRSCTWTGRLRLDFHRATNQALQILH